MNILLINPSLIKAEIRHYSKSIEKNRGIYPPLGLSYVAASLLKAGHYVQIIDYDLEDRPIERILFELKSRDYGLVGFYTMTWTFNSASEILRQIKKVKPSIRSVFGGPNASSLPEVSLEISDFDYLVMGEGEETIVELVEAIEGKIPIKLVKGIIYRDSRNQINQNQRRQLQDDVSRISFPAWGLLKVNAYYDILARYSRFSTMIASRGCPFSCTFCDRLNRMGNNWRVRTPENVIAEMRLLNFNYGTREIMFYDDNFIFNKKWIYEFCDKLGASKLKIAWECRARVDMIDRELLKRMKSSGCYRIRYGMESGNNEILRILKKGITVEQIRECAGLSEDAGIEVFAYFMMGSPFETPQTLQDTLNLALRINASFTVFSKTILIVGSELFDWAVSKNYIDEDYWVNFLKGKSSNPAPALSTAQLSEEYVDSYISYAYKKFYLRPQYLAAKIKNINNFGQAGRQVRLALSFLSN